jgi:iron complex transport system ATP-binding protein
MSAASASPPLELRGASLGIGTTARLQPTHLAFEPGTITAIIGPNGSGKSTLLGLMSGDVEPTEGLVLMNGSAASEMSTTMLARHRSLLAQETTVAFPFLVREVVTWGRLAWRRTPSSTDDARIIDAALESQGLAALRDNPALRASFGAAAHARAVRDFGLDPMLDRMEAVFRAVCEARPIPSVRAAG